jgi:Rad9
MDCMIPSHHVKIFSSAINCMNKIGSDIYIEYDILNGLLLHTLNDSKSAYTCFHFNIHYFERCTKPPTSTIVSAAVSKRKRKKKRPLYPITTTITSDDDDNDNSKNNDADDENDMDNDDDHNEKYLCRIPLRSLTAALRPRKGVISLRIRNEDSTTITNDITTTNNETTTSLISYLSFEYNIQSSLSSVVDDDVILNVIHKVGIANEISCQRAIISDRDDASILIASPTVWLRLLEPVIIQKSNEVAIAIRRRRTSTNKDGVDPNNNNTIVSSVSATSFHYRTDTTQQRNGTNSNGGAGSVSAIVKSENRPS